MHLSRRELLHRAGLVIAGHATLPAFGQTQKPVEFQRIRLGTSKLGEMRDYYATTLGLPTTLEGGILKVTAGKSALEFTAAAAGTKPYYHFAFNIPENKLAASMEWLRPRCPIFKSADGREVYNFANWNAHSCYFHDPAGNILEFIARHTLSNAAAGGFDVRDILNVSEIALVAPALPAIAEKLKSDLGVHDYPGTSSGFMPIGNEHGLFILMSSGRAMLGGTALAEQHPVEVRIRDDRRQRLTWDGMPFLVESGG
jgi:hypothetical protein